MSFKEQPKFEAQSQEEGGIVEDEIKLEENKKERLVLQNIADKDVVVEFVKKEVKFPERLVEDTGGVEGYDRYKINFETLRAPLQQILGNSVVLADAPLFSNEFWDNYRDEEGRFTETGELIWKKHRLLLGKIVDEITEGKFPKNTRNHVFGGVWGGPRGKHSSFQDLLNITKTEKIILQKIYHPETFLKILERDTAKDNEEIQFFFTVRSKQKMYSSRERLFIIERQNDDGSISEVTADEIPEDNVGMRSLLNPDIYTIDQYANIKYNFRTEKKNWKKALHEVIDLLKAHPNYFMVSAGIWGYRMNYVGLSTLKGEGKGYAGDPDTLPTYRKSMVGFSHKNSAFRNYIDGIFNVFLPLIKKRLLEDEGRLNDGTPGSFNYDMLIKCILFLKFEGMKIDDIPEEVRSFFQQIPSYKSYYKNYKKPGTIIEPPVEIGIPIIINHPKVPDLRWCHAQYAVIPTEKSFNLLIMKSKQDKS